MQLTEPTKIIYAKGENFDPTGMVVTATYTDGTTKAVTGYTIINGESLTKESLEVTVSYTEGEITKTTTQAITVGDEKSCPCGIYQCREEHAYEHTCQK